MPGRPLEIAAEDFAAAAPLGFVAEQDGVITCVGDALARRLSVTAGDHVDDIFEVVRPPRTASFSDLEADPRATVILRTRHQSVALKGMAIAVQPGDRVAYFGSTPVSDLEDFRSKGLMIADFPPNDMTPDLLLSKQATNTALRDARDLSRDLQNALSEARSASETKARFLAIMSHEIRTPLNGFGAMIDLLREGDLTNEQRSHLETMERCSRSLLALVNDILDFSKLEAGKVALHRRPTQPAKAILTMIEQWSAAAAELDLELTVRLNVPSDTFVAMDYERVRQVIANLIGNALKFTPTGGVCVTAQVAAAGRITVDVEDTGVGVPDARRGLLFDPFVQADTSATRRFAGTGLGLSISRQLAEAMDGTVELVRTGSSGSLFRFSFVAPPCAAPPDDAATDAAAAGHAADEISVLVAEDDPMNQVIIEKLLDQLDANSTIVHDGAEALEAATHSSYDLILMDVMMPNMDGLEATRSIRAADGPCRDVPIIACTASAFDADRANAAAAGMNDFLEKPIRLAQLRAALTAHAPSKAATPDAD
jgi:signal transduction histidine kinase/ActR/RegA family two-component response regulator